MTARSPPSTKEKEKREGGVGGWIRGGRSGQPAKFARWRCTLCAVFPPSLFSLSPPLLSYLCTATPAARSRPGPARPSSGPAWPARRRARRLAGWGRPLGREGWRVRARVWRGVCVQGGARCRRLKQRRRVCADVGLFAPHSNPPFFSLVCALPCRARPSRRPAPHAGEARRREADESRRNRARGKTFFSTLTMSPLKRSAFDIKEAASSTNSTSSLLYEVSTSTLMFNRVSRKLVSKPEAFKLSLLGCVLVLKFGGIKGSPGRFSNLTGSSPSTTS